MAAKTNNLLRNIMDWLSSFDLFLFDFDGLLVNTEELHFEAYKRGARAYSLTLDWDMDEYGSHAYFSATGLKEALRKKFPKVFDTDEKWRAFYATKKQAYIDLIGKGRAELMPGVKPMLEKLNQLGKKTCVVTNSSLPMVAPIRDQIEELGLISHWITREDYTEPKPSPQGYQLAIDTLGLPKDKVIGFEDTIKGLKALLGTKVQAVLVSQGNYLSEDNKWASVDQELRNLSLKKGAIWSPSFSELLDLKALASSS